MVSEAAVSPVAAGAVVAVVASGAAALPHRVPVHGGSVEVVPLTSIVEEWGSRGLALVEPRLEFSNPIRQQGLLRLPRLVAG